jgi:hypothetical protein
MGASVSMSMCVDVDMDMDMGVSMSMWVWACARVSVWRSLVSECVRGSWSVWVRETEK